MRNEEDAKKWLDECAATREECLAEIKKCEESLALYERAIEHGLDAKTHEQVLEAREATQESLDVTRAAVAEREMLDLVLYALILHPKLEVAGNALDWLQQEGFIYSNKTKQSETNGNATSL